MNEIVSRIAGQTGLDPKLVEPAAGMMLGLVQRHAADGPVTRLISDLPGGIELAARYNAAASEKTGDTAGASGILGGIANLFGTSSGGLGGSISGAAEAMEMATTLNERGLSNADIRSIGKELLALGRLYSGDQTVDRVIESVPGLSGLVR